jgi:predicted N-acetyltransferase YhbS
VIYRMATPADRDALIELGTSFMGEYRHTMAVVTEIGARAAARVDDVLDRGVACVAEDRAGQIVAMLGFLVAAHPMTGVMTAFEVAWYVHPVQRGGSVALRLVREAEIMALAAGATRLQIGAPDDKVAHFLNRAGYVVAETTFVKELA